MVKFSWQIEETAYISMVCGINLFKLNLTFYKSVFISIRFDNEIMHLKNA
jgi:hypothetical protein